MTAHRGDELVSRGTRILAATTLAVAVATVGAAAWVGGAQHPLVLLAGAALLLGLGIAFERRRPGPSTIGTTALVGAVVLASLAVRAWVDPTGAGLDVFLGVSGAVTVVLGYLGDERRLVTVGLGQWAVALGRPHPGGPVFRHCLVATDVAVPLPRLEPVLLLSIAAIAVGTVHRRRQTHLEAGRGVEVAGLVGLHVSLLAKAVELPGLEQLCGTGDAVDAGWMVLGLLVALATGWYGLRGRDAVWAGAGLLALGGYGLAGPLLARQPLWGLAALVPLTAMLVLVERAGIPWPRQPGYGEARPTVGRLRILDRWGRDDGQGQPSAASEETPAMETDGHGGNGSGP